MTRVELLWKMEAIIAVVPALLLYRENGLLLAVGAYAGLVIVLGVATALIDACLSSMFSKPGKEE